MAAGNSATDTAATPTQPPLVATEGFPIADPVTTSSKLSEISPVALVLILILGALLVAGVIYAAVTRKPGPIEDRDYRDDL